MKMVIASEVIITTQKPPRVLVLRPAATQEQNKDASQVTVWMVAGVWRTATGPGKQRYNKLCD